MVNESRIRGKLGRRSAKRAEGSSARPVADEAGRDSVSGAADVPILAPAIEPTTTLAPAAPALPAPTEERAPDGRWVKGQSGNPSGRPPSKAQRIADLQRTLEEYVRSKVRPERMVKIIEKLCDKAEEGDVKAAATLMQYTMTKPQLTEEADDKAKGGIVIRIENATFKAQHPQPNGNTYEGETT